MDVLFNKITLFVIAIMVVTAFLVYSVTAIRRIGVVAYFKMIGQVGKAIASSLGAIVASLISFLAASANTSDEILDEQNDQPMQNTGLIGEYNFRTHKLDEGTDPDGWYEEDM